MTRSPLSRRNLALAGLAATLLCASSLTLANDWPSKPIKIIVPWPAGGATDVASRIVGEKLALRLKQPVVIENKPGAAGVIGTLQAVQSAPDGYTFTMMTTPTPLAAFLYKNKQVDVTKDLMPVAAVYDLPNVLVINPKVLPGVKTLPELIAKIKAANGEFNYTTSSPGSLSHISMVQLQDLGGFRMQHIAYKGGPAAMADVLGGQIGMMFGDLAITLPQIKAGRLIPLAVGSAQRIEQLPDVKTFIEQGFQDFEVVAWGGLLAPLGTPQPVVNRISSEIKEILGEQDVRQRLVQAGTPASYKDSAQMGKYLKTFVDKWGTVIREKNIVAD